MSGLMVYRDVDWEHGMLCESCDQPFRDGDEILTSPLSMFEDGTLVLGDNMCPRCWAKGAA